MAVTGPLTGEPLSEPLSGSLRNAESAYVGGWSWVDAPLLRKFAQEGLEGQSNCAPPPAVMKQFLGEPLGFEAPQNWSLSRTLGPTSPAVLSRRLHSDH